MINSAEDFLLLNGAIVMFLVAYFLLIRKKPRHPVQLKFKGNSGAPSNPAKGPAGETIVLNVMFNFNGHSFDAYEALGVPAGSQLQEVEQAYRQQCASADASSKEFFEAAYLAIQGQLTK